MLRTRVKAYARKKATQNTAYSDRCSEPTELVQLHLHIKSKRAHTDTQTQIQIQARIRKERGERGKTKATVTQFSWLCEELS